MTWTQQPSPDVNSMHQSHQSGEKGTISRRRFLKGTAAGLGALALQRMPLQATAGGLVKGGLLQIAEAVNVMDPAFGAVGDGQTNDRAAFQAAIDMAIEQGRPLFIPRPPEFYRIVLEPNHANLIVGGDITIQGESRDATTLRFTVQNAGEGKSYAGIFVVGGIRFQLTDLRLEEDLHQPVEQFEFMGMFFESGGRDHPCLVERVDVVGFTHCLYTPASGVDGGQGELFLEVRDCDLQPWWQYAIAFWAVAGGHKRLHVYDSFLHDNQFSHLIYCHPHNSVHIENTRFDGATSWAFQFQGSAVAGNPEYQRFVGCWFGPRNGRGIITQDRADVATRVEVHNCVFEGRPSIQIRSDILVDGCYFTTLTEIPNNQPFVSAYSNSPWSAVIRNCIFAPRANTLPQADFRLDNIDVTIENCQFYNQGSGVMINLGTGPANTYKISDCLFYNRVDNASQSIAIEIDNGRATIDRCRFVGRAIGDRGVIVCTSNETGPSPDSFLQIDHCIFQDISGGSVFYVAANSANSWSNKIAGENNRFIRLLTGQPMMVVEPFTPVYGRLAPAPGQSPTPLSAGPAMVISSNYDTYQVIGTADISRLHWWTEDGLSDPLFSGTITLVGGTPFSLVTGGNIQFPDRAIRNEVAAGQSIRLFYASDQATWTVVL
jgi:hypothetical protein